MEGSMTHPFRVGQENEMSRKQRVCSGKQTISRGGPKSATGSRTDYGVSHILRIYPSFITITREKTTAISDNPKLLRVGSMLREKDLGERDEFRLNT